LTSFDPALIKDITALVSGVAATILLFSWVPYVLVRLLKRGEKSHPSGKRGCSNFCTALSLLFAAVVAAKILISSASFAYGLDAVYYTSLVESMKSSSVPSALLAALLEKRTAVVLATYALSVALPISTALALVFLASLALYLTSAKIALERRLSGEALLAASLSPHVFMAIYAGIYANFAALPLMYAVIFSSFEERSKRFSEILLLVVLVLAYFCHPWSYYYALIILAALYLLGRRKEKPVALLASMAIVAAVEAARIAAVPSGATTVYGAGLGNVLQYPRDMYATFRYYLGGVLRYPYPFLLSLVGLVGAFKERRDDLMSFLVLSSVLSLVVSPSYKWRALFYVPWHCFLAYGATVISEAALRYVKRARPVPKRLEKAIRTAVSAVLLLPLGYYLVFLDEVPKYPA